MSQSGIFISGSFPAHPVETLTGNTGGAVGPNGAGNINIVGNGTSVSFAGNPGTNTLTLTVTGGGLTWVSTAVNVNPVVANTGYITTSNAATVVLTLPNGGTVGDIIRVAGLGTGGAGQQPWQINASTNGQTIVGSGFNSNTTITAGAQYDEMDLVYTGANIWFVLNAMGNPV